MNNNIENNQGNLQQAQIFALPDDYVPPALHNGLIPVQQNVGNLEGDYSVVLYQLNNQRNQALALQNGNPQVQGVNNDERWTTYTNAVLFGLNVGVLTAVYDFLVHDGSRSVIDDINIGAVSSLAYLAIDATRQTAGYIYNNLYRRQNAIPNENQAQNVVNQAQNNNVLFHNLQNQQQNQQNQLG